MASRLLRVNILSPITGKYEGAKRMLDLANYWEVQSSIDARLDVVEGSPPREFNVLAHLIAIAQSLLTLKSDLPT